MAIEVNGKTYRTLEEQVYYLTEKVSEIAEDVRVIAKIDVDEPTSTTVEGNYIIYEGLADITYEDGGVESIEFSYYVPNVKVQSVNGKTGAVVLSGTDIKTNATGVSKTVKQDIDLLYESVESNRDDIGALENEIGERPIVSGEYTGDNWTEITIGSTTKNIGGGGGSDVHLYRHVIKLTFDNTDEESAPWTGALYVTLINTRATEYESYSDFAQAIKYHQVQCSGVTSIIPDFPDRLQIQAIDYDEDLSSFDVYAFYNECDEGITTYYTDIYEYFLVAVSDDLTQIF